jgi:hypothetical protein
VSNFSIQARKLLPFQLADVKDQLRLNLGKDQHGEILKLIYEFRDCFALDTRELGKTNVTDMHIRLHERNIVQNLMDNGILRESESP